MSPCRGSEFFLEAGQALTCGSCRCLALSERAQDLGPLPMDSRPSRLPAGNGQGPEAGLWGPRAAPGAAPPPGCHFPPHGELCLVLFRPMYCSFSLKCPQGPSVFAETHYLPFFHAPPCLLENFPNSHLGSFSENSSVSVGALGSVDGRSPYKS